MIIDDHSADFFIDQPTLIKKPETIGLSGSACRSLDELLLISEICSLLYGTKIFSF